MQQLQRRNPSTLSVTLLRPAVSQEAFEYGASRPITGLGDEAYYSSDVHWLRVKQASTRFQVNCVACQGAELPTLTSVAERVLARL